MQQNKTKVVACSVLSIVLLLSMWLVSTYWGETPEHEPFICPLNVKTSFLTEENAKNQSLSWWKCVCFRSFCAARILKPSRQTRSTFGATPGTGETGEFNSVADIYLSKNKILNLNESLNLIHKIGRYTW